LEHNISKGLQKGGFQHTTEHLDMGSDEILCKIKQSYKTYVRLKKDKGWHEAWTSQLIESQATNQNVTKNQSGNVYKEWRRSTPMHGRPNRYY